MPRTPRTRAFALLALVLLTACSGEVQPIRIGVAGALSDPIGEPMRRAARLAVAEINAAGGVRGRRLELLERDDYASPDSAVRIAAELYWLGRGGGGGASLLRHRPSPRPRSTTAAPRRWSRSPRRRPPPR